MNQVSTSTSPFACKVCGQKAHGNHFGVISCRACAAFFRRTAGSKWSKLPCRGGSCDKRSFYCKPCRLERCQDKGMSTEKFQFNREGILVPGQFKLPQSMEYIVGRPEFLLFCDTEPPNAKVLIDVRYLLEEATRLLNNGLETPYQAENQLKKLNLGFKFIQVDTANIKTVSAVGQKELMELWEHYFLTVTKWLLHFDEFQKINRNLQMTLLQAVWHVWSKLHKITSTSIYRRINSQARKTEMIMKNVFMDMESMKLDSAWMSDYPPEQVGKFMGHHGCNDYDPIDALVQLEPTEMELTYMFAQLCFEYAGKRYQGEMLKVTDHFQDVLGNDMHDYYANEMNRPRYFHRLSKLLKVNNAVQKSIWEQRPRMELGRVFNVLKLEYSHPEMFEDSGFY